ncbi:MAG TPA: trypco2 family protein [Thermoanaerobaculia bacterium]|nr:trypco2 family protein [Thermoanaerobaculia bacterium]
MRPLIALGLALTLSSGCATSRDSLTPEQAAVRIADLVSAVGSALAEAQPVLAENGLALKSASVTVEAESSDDKSLGVDWTVVSAEASKTSERTAELTVALDVANLPPAATSSNSKALRGTLLSIVHAVKNRKPDAAPIAFESLTIQIEFTVTSKREGGLAFEVLSAVKLEPEVTKSRTRSHTLSVTLSRKTGS